MTFAVKVRRDDITFEAAKHVADPNAAHCAKTMANIRGHCSKEPIWQCELNIFYSSDFIPASVLALK